jgi:tripartite-type tricarboxylate transporter receptor subunit TctC
MRSAGTRLLVSALSAVAMIASLAATAQDDFPSRAIRIIVPYPPGGAADLLTRLVAGKLAQQFAQPIVVENKPGASGNIGAGAVARAAPDGYSLLSAPPPPLVINQSLFPQLGFDPARFVAVTVIASTPNVLVVNPKLAATQLVQLIELAKAQPGKLSYASTGSGGTPHLTAEWFNAAAGVQITHIPYKGALAYPAVLSGEVQMMFMNLGDALPHLRAGTLRALAVCSERTSAALPDVPTMAATIPGFVSSTWFAIVAPPGTPPAIADKLSAAVAAALKSPELGKRLADLYFEPVGSPPAQTAAFFAQEVQRWKQVIRRADIKPD